jgi:DNA-binding transcriptional LysR family regulator
VETTSYLVIRSMLMESNMIAALPTEVLDAERRQGLIANLSVRLDLRLPPIGIVRLTNRNPSPAVLTVIEEIKKVGKRTPSLSDTRTT